MTHEQQAVPEASVAGPSSASARRELRVTVPEAVALLGLSGPKALRRLLAAAGLKLRRSALGEPVLRGGDLRALTTWQLPSERPHWVALERVLQRACREALLLHRDLVADIRRDCSNAERAARTERYAHALLRAVGYGFIEATPGVNAAFYTGPTRGTTRKTVARVRKLIVLVQHPE